MRGNPCLVHLLQSAPASAPAPAAVTQCVTWPASPGTAEVRCWAPSGSEIELCGHGLLCCASAWLDRGNEWQRLTMNKLEVRVESHGGLRWLGFPTLAVEHCDVPDWAAQLLGSVPERAACAGPESGYLLLEMTADCELSRLPAPGDALAAHATRSLIVTRKVDGQQALYGEGIQYRYFAPQFGVPEDTATGSAMRVLASYWQGRGAGDVQRALQCSAAGGWLESRIAGEHTWIGGHVVNDEVEGTP